jgi:hypothetical protein
VVYGGKDELGCFRKGCSGGDIFFGKKSGMITFSYKLNRLSIFLTQKKAIWIPGLQNQNNHVGL